METNWIPGLVVLAVGLVGGGLYLFMLLRQGKSSAAAMPESSTDLDLRAQRLIEQLRELELQRHTVSTETYSAERQRLELEAAAAFRARDEGAQGGKAARQAKATASGPAAPRGFFGRH